MKDDTFEKKVQVLNKYQSWNQVFQINQHSDNSHDKQPIQLLIQGMGGGCGGCSSGGGGGGGCSGGGGGGGCHGCGGCGQGGGAG